MTAVQVILLVNILSRASPSGIRILDASTALAACLGLVPLLLFEHKRSVRPSDLALIYLLATLTCDVLRFWAALYAGSALHHAYLSLRHSWPIILNICIKIALLVAESQGKEQFLREPHRQYAPEQLAGVLSRTFFWWINPILAQGRRVILTEDSLPPVDHGLSSKSLRHKALLSWDQRGISSLHPSLTICTMKINKLIRSS